VGTNAAASPHGRVAIITGNYRYVYGPVPSRRLGRSLGVDVVPFKTCTYDCIYCQLGRTTSKTIERKEYVPVEEILVELERRLPLGPPPDYLSLAGSGEPTLNGRIGELIGRIKSLTRIPVAVLTNGSLLWMRDVQDALMEADLILPSLDAGDERLFRYVNRPHREIVFENMVCGIAEFTARFPKSVWLEVFLLAGITGVLPEAEKIAALTRRIRPERVQLNTISRPPSEPFTRPVSRGQLTTLASLFGRGAEVISEGEGSRPRPSTVNIEPDEEIVALLRRRPCTLRDVAAGLGIPVAQAAKRLEVLAAASRVRAVFQNTQRFYLAVPRKHAS
jgi:wyosine [tRNA(Phe)-imidazoG37] synthetase (radical SAM superfamily)